MFIFAMHFFWKYKINNRKNSYLEIIEKTMVNNLHRSLSASRCSRLVILFYFLIKLLQFNQLYFDICFLKNHMIKEVLFLVETGAVTTAVAPVSEVERPTDFPTAAPEPEERKFLFLFRCHQIRFIQMHIMILSDY